MKKIVYIFAFLLFLVILFPLNINAKGIEYARTITENESRVIRSIDTSDGGYAVLALVKGRAKRQTKASSSSWCFAIFKYSSDGSLLWNNTYDYDVTNYSISSNISNSTIVGFTELGNGNLYVAANDFAMTVSDSGTFINSYDMYDQLGKNYVEGGFRCTDSICAAIKIGSSKIDRSLEGILFKVNDNGFISKIVDIPQVSLIPGKNNYVGLPVSLFKNSDGNYVVETVEGTVTYIYVYDKDLNQISKDLFAINNSGINAFNITGNLYWVLGQFNNGNYFGVNIDYKGSTGISSASYVLLSSDLTSVLKESKISESYIDMQSKNMNQQQETLMYSLGFTAYYGIADGIRDGRYVSLLNYVANTNCYKRKRKSVSVPKNSGVITYAFDRNLFLKAIVLRSADPIACGNISFVRIDSNLDVVETIPIGVVPNLSLRQMAFMVDHSSVVRLKDGDDVVVTNSNQIPNSNLARHIKIGKLLVATSIAANPNDITFEKNIYQTGDIVKMQLRQKDGYYIDKVIVRDETGKIIPVDLKNQTFVMPESDVTVDVQYKKIEQVKTGILTSIILSLITLGMIGYSNIKYFKKKAVN